MQFKLINNKVTKILYPINKSFTMATTSHNDDRVKEATPLSVNDKIETDTWRRVGS